jgi:hypothetical protein
MSDAPETIWFAPDGVFGVKYTRTDLIPQWQPIEIAPKDGTELFLFDVYRYVGAWRNDDNDDGRAPRQWFDNSYDDFSCGYASTPLTPTHWMPLPDDPT